LRIGRNVLAVHCQDVDAGALIDAALYVASDPSLGRKELVREFDSMIQQDPANAAVYAGRANAEARLGWWQKAAADLAKAIELKPGVERYWSQLGPLYLQMGDLPGYEFHRERALAKFGDPDGPTVGEPVAKLCLLLPANGPGLQPAMKLAESASGPGYALSTLARRQWTEGLAEFRQGRFASAIEWMRKAQATCVRPELPAWDHERERNLNTGGYLVEALAYQELNQTVEAQVALAKGAELFHTQLPQTDSGDIGREWPDWLIVQILLREAQSGVKEKTDVDHP
jgi:tetratricopeptide (TPR) repeat protein